MKNKLLKKFQDICSRTQGHGSRAVVRYLTKEGVRNIIF